jgi:hypothetical protein
MGLAASRHGTEPNTELFVSIAAQSASKSYSRKICNPDTVVIG